MPGERLTIGLLQHACGPDRAANVAACERLARDAAGRGAELLVTQELFAGIYFPQVEDEARLALAEPIPGPTSDHLAALAHELGVHVSASLFERRAPGVFHNTSILLDPEGQIAGRYRKMHIPDDPRFYEKYYFTPGDLGFGAPAVGDWPVGMLVCWDQWFPEAARLTALHGARLLLYPTAIGWHEAPDGRGETPEDRRRQLEAWQIMQRSHAIANGVYVAAINRIGREDELVFWGRSFVADPAGQIVAQAPADEPAALVVDCDGATIDAWRQGWPFFRDRRIDAYEPITRRLVNPA
jgi:N-carbamoylputrescine amidase